MSGISAGNLTGSSSAKYLTRGKVVIKNAAESDPDWIRNSVPAATLRRQFATAHVGFRGDSEFPARTVRYLGQKDFNDGPVVITDDDVYVVLKSDVQLTPAVVNGMPAWGGLVLAGDNIVLDGTNHSIQQSPEDELFMRFHVGISLNTRLFPKNTGPPVQHSSGVMKNASRVTIKNVNLSASSHFGVFGRDNTYVVMNNVTVARSQVANVQLNGPKHVMIQNCMLLGTHGSNLANPRFSHAQQMLLWLDRLPSSLLNAARNTAATVRGRPLVLGSTFDTLKELMEEYKTATLLGPGGRTPPQHFLFSPQADLSSDCSVVGALRMTKPGIAAGPNPSTEGPTTGTVILENVTASNVEHHQHMWPSWGDSRAAEGATYFSRAHDGAGGVINARDLVLGGNELTDAQVMRSVFENNQPNTDPSMPKDLLDFAVGNTAVYDYPVNFTEFDAMGHVNKGIIAVDVGHAKELLVRQVRVTNMKASVLKFTQATTPHALSGVGYLVDAEPPLAPNLISNSGKLHDLLVSTGRAAFLPPGSINSEYQPGIIDTFSWQSSDGTITPGTNQEVVGIRLLAARNSRAVKNIINDDVQLGVVEELHSECGDTVAVQVNGDSKLSGAQVRKLIDIGSLSASNGIAVGSRINKD